MLLNITKPQYRTLVEMLALATITIDKLDEYELISHEEMHEYQTFTQSILKHYKKMDCPDAVSYCRDDKRYEPSEALDDHWLYLLEQAERIDFIERLASHLAGRDDALNPPKKFNSDKAMEQFFQCQNHYLDAFEQSGLSRLVLEPVESFKKRLPAKLDMQQFFDEQAIILTSGHSALLKEEALADFLQDLEKNLQPNSKPSKNLTNKVVPLHSNSQPALALENESILQLKISVKGAKPPVWRRVQLASSLNLVQLHDIIQILFNLEGYHLHGFIYGQDMIDENREAVIKIGNLLRVEKQKIQYEYDFGDSWQFVIELEKRLESAVPGATPPVQIITGKRGGLYEDIGGVWALNDLANALKENKPLPPHLAALPDLDRLEVFDKEKIQQTLQVLF